jgi:6-phosphogluconolactonase
VSATDADTGEADAGDALAVEALDDAEAAARRGAELIIDAARGAVAERGRFTLAISGGRTPWPMLAQVAADPEMPLEQTELFQVDERVAPDGDPERNWTRAAGTLPLGELLGAHPMPVTKPDLESASGAYEELLPDRLDLVHLGIGPDGHTASLVPGDPVLDVLDRRVALTGGEYQGRHRMTLTYPTLDAARRILWLVGEDAREALSRLLVGDRSIPAGRVARENAVVIADRSTMPARDHRQSGA